MYKHPLDLEATSDTERPFQWSDLWGRDSIYEVYSKVPIRSPKTCDKGLREAAFITIIAESSLYRHVYACRLKEIYSTVA